MSIINRQAAIELITVIADPLRIHARPFNRSMKWLVQFN
jgi:hypothetical protein